MAELRWILLIVGAVVVGGVYLWSKRQFDDDRSANNPSYDRAEPTLGPSGNSEMDSKGPVSGAVHDNNQQ